MNNVTILIVEDEPIIAADLEDRLTNMGYSVVESLASGEEALEFLKNKKPDLVIMDVQLEGDLDGVETTEQIKTMYDIPVIFLTGNTDQLTFSRAKATQPHAYISKPFRGKDLQHSIELALAKAESPQQEVRTVADDTEAFVLKDRIFVKDGERMSRIFLKEILWLSANDYYCDVHTLEKKYLLSMTLKKLLERPHLSEYVMRIHRSYAINVEKIEELGDYFVVIRKEKIPVSKTYQKDLLKRLQVL